METEAIRKEFGKRIQLYRKRLSLTQGQLAEKIDRTEETISNIERGISSTRIETAAMIAEVLGVSLPDLFDLPLYTTGNREKMNLIKELVSLAVDQDDRMIKVFIDHLKNLSELPGNK